MILLKKGYLFIPNFFNEYEVENLKKSMKRKTNLQSENFNDFKESLWDFVANKKVIHKVKVLTGKRRYFYIALLCYAKQLVQITVGIEIIHIDKRE